VVEGAEIPTIIDPRAVRPPARGGRANAFSAISNNILQYSSSRTFHGLPNTDVFDGFIAQPTNERFEISTDIETTSKTDHQITRKTVVYELNDYKTYSTKIRVAKFELYQTTVVQYLWDWFLEPIFTLSYTLAIITKYQNL